MNKQELVNKVAESGLSRTQAASAVNALFDAISDSLSRGDKVTIPGFGTFDISERAARKGRNPQTGEMIDVPASKAPKFKAGATLKSAVNG